MEKGLGLGWIEASSRGGRGQLTWLGVEGEEEPLCLLGVEGEDEPLCLLAVMHCCHNTLINQHIY